MRGHGIDTYALEDRVRVERRLQRREQHERAVAEDVGLAEVDAVAAGHRGDRAEGVEQVTAERAARPHVHEQLGA